MFLFLSKTNHSCSIKQNQKHYIKNNTERTLKLQISSIHKTLVIINVHNNKHVICNQNLRIEKTQTIYEENISSICVAKTIYYQCTPIGELTA